MGYAISTGEWHVGLAFCTLYTFTYRTTWYARRVFNADKTDNLCSFLCRFKASFKMMPRMDQDRDDGDAQGYGNVKMLLIRTGAYFPSPSSPCAGASCWVCASAAGSSVIYSAVPKGMRTPLSLWNDASSFSKYSLGRQLVPEVV